MRIQLRATEAINLQRCLKTIKPKTSTSWPLQTTILPTLRGTTVPEHCHLTSVRLAEINSRVGRKGWGLICIPMSTSSLSQTTLTPSGQTSTMSVAIPSRTKSLRPVRRYIPHQSSWAIYWRKQHCQQKQTASLLPAIIPLWPITRR